MSTDRSVSELSIAADGAWLDARLLHAPDDCGLVIIARAAAGCLAGSEEGEVVAALREAGLASLTLDLLTQREEARDPDVRFNVPMLTHRLLAIREWIAHQPRLSWLAVGVHGSDTASAVAIRGAWKEPERFAAVVCRGGRPDLAGATPLTGLRVPARFIAGSAASDPTGFRAAFERVGGERDWQAFSGADHEITAGEALNRAAALAAAWFTLHLPPPDPQRSQRENEAARAPTQPRDGWFPGIDPR
jgi:hypothetical protein